MAKTSDMIGHHTPAQGEVGRDIPTEMAEAMAGDMRRLLAADFDEVTMSSEIRAYSRMLDHDTFVAAWEFLNAMERRAWKAYVSYEEWLRLECVRVENKRAD